MKDPDHNARRSADILRALAHPERIAILKLLRNKGGRFSVTQIHEKLGLTQSETSRHLGLLRHAGILDLNKEGAHAYYFINERDQLVKDIVACLSQGKKYSKPANG